MEVFGENLKLYNIRGEYSMKITDEQIERWGYSWKRFSPTPRQITKLFKKIGDGEITRAEFERFLNGYPGGYDLATAILGEDFITPEEISKYIGGIQYLDSDIQDLKTSIPSEKILDWLAGDYTLVAGPPRPMSVKEIVNSNPSFFGGNALVENYRICGKLYPKNERFLKEEIPAGWIILRKSFIRGAELSSGKTYFSSDESNENELSHCYIPNVAKVMWVAYVCKAIRKRNLLPKKWIATNSQSNYKRHNGESCNIALKIRKKINLAYISSGGVSGNVGVLVARKK
ncbi:MAG: hypothetical protein WC678_01530 [Parcubacteria group bacterium]